MEIPEVRYAKTADGTHIAFQVFGRGPRDLVYVPGFISNVLLNWELPGMAHILDRLARFARVVVIDHRGTGLSDRLPPGHLPPLETQMEDLTAVMDAVHIRKAHLFGDEDGAALCALFAASYPERVESLSVYALTPRLLRTDDYPFGRDEVIGRAQLEERMAMWDRAWGIEAAREDYEFAAPSVAHDEEEVKRWARYLQLSASPGSALAMIQMWLDTDVRAVLPTVRVPTLVLTRPDLPHDRSQVARWVADQIEGARFAEVPGRDLASWVGDTDALIDEVEGFVTGVKGGTSSERVLATVLFTEPRRIDGACRRTRRLTVEGAARIAPDHGSSRAREVPRAGDRHSGRRVLRDLRRPGAGGPVRASRDRRRAVLGSRGPSRRPHGRGRDLERRRARYRGPHRSARRIDGPTERGPRHVDGPGSGRRQRTRVRR